MVFSALTIAGSDSGGGAGIQADLKTFAAHRVHGLCVITSLTAQNTSEVAGVSDVPLDFIEKQFDAVHWDFNIGAAKTGMLSNRSIIKTVSKKIGSYPLVVDPVMVAESGGKLLDDDAVAALVEGLLPKAVLATPNIHEAEILSGQRIKKMEDMKKAAKEISKYGCSVVVKGGHLNASDVLYTNEGYTVFKASKLEGRFHGSGCTFSASIAANLTLGFDILSSIWNAKHFIQGALETAYSPGKKDVKAVNQMRIEFEDFYDEVLLEVRKAVCELESLKGLAKHCPEVGMNICYAKKGASQLEEVAGLTGRLIRTGVGLRAMGSVEYAASKHMARVVLAAMDFDPETRSALNLKYRPRTLELVKKKTDLSVSSFDRRLDPAKGSTMEWGTREAIKALGRVPDIVYDEGGTGKEPMIRILGKDPADVISKLKMILEAVNGL